MPLLVIHRLRTRLPCRGPRAGFSLLEMLVAVIVVGVMVTLSIPSISRQMKSRRTNQAANEIALIYRQARARAMGRGAAVLVRYKQNTYGRVELREAINGTTGTGQNGSCAALPATSCQGCGWTSPNGVDADGPDNRLITSFDPTYNSVYSGVSLALVSPTASTQTDADICFSPLGRPYYRWGQTGTFSPLTEVPYITVSRSDGVGFTRSVLVLPNGASRLAL